MKKMLKLLGIMAALAMVLGFGLTACSSGGDDDDDEFPSKAKTILVAELVNAGIPEAELDTITVDKITAEPSGVVGLEIVKEGENAGLKLTSKKAGTAVLTYKTGGTDIIFTVTVGKDGEITWEASKKASFDEAKSVISHWKLDAEEIDLAALVTHAKTADGSAATITQANSKDEVTKIMTMNDIEIAKESGLKLVLQAKDDLPFSSDSPNYRFNKISPSYSSDATKAEGASAGSIEPMSPQLVYVANVQGPFKVTMYYGSNGSSAKTDRYHLFKVGTTYDTAEEFAKESEKAGPSTPIITSYSAIYKGTDIVTVWFGTNTKVARIYDIIIDQNEGYADAVIEPEPEPADPVIEKLDEIETSLEGYTFSATGVTPKDAAAEISWVDFLADANNKAAYNAVKSAVAAGKFDEAKYPQLKALMDAMPEDVAPKSKYEELSGAANNLIKEDFATATTVSQFSGIFGIKGVLGEWKEGSDGVKVVSGAAKAKNTDKKDNMYVVVDFGPVTGTIEGCFNASLDELSSGSDYIMFYDGDMVVFNLTDKYVFKTIKGVAPLPTMPSGVAAHAANKDCEYYYSINLETGAMTLEIDGVKALDNVTTGIKSVSGLKIGTSNGGKRGITVDNIAVCGTAGDLASYKTQVKGWLADLISGSYTSKYTTNASEVATAKSNGEAAIDAAEDIAGVQAAYIAAGTALKAIKDDDTIALETAKTTAKADLAAYKVETNYSAENWAKIQAEITKGNTAIDAATTTEAVTTALTAAKAEIDKIPDNSAVAVTVTVHYNDGTDDKTAAIAGKYTGMKVTEDEVKTKAPAPSGKKYKATHTGSLTGAAYDFDIALTGNLDLYVEFEDGSEVKTYTFVPPYDAKTYNYADSSKDKDGNLPKEVASLEDSSYTFSWGVCNAAPVSRQRSKPYSWKYKNGSYITTEGGGSTGSGDSKVINIVTAVKGKKDNVSGENGIVFTNLGKNVTVKIIAEKPTDGRALAFDIVSASSTDTAYPSADVYFQQQVTATVTVGDMPDDALYFANATETAPSAKLNESGRDAKLYTWTYSNATTALGELNIHATNDIDIFWIQVITD